MHIVLYFFIYSFLGFIIDSLYSSFVMQDVVLGGWFKSFLLPVPIAPIYGFGALLVILLIPIIKKFPPVIRAIIPGLLFTLIGYLGGVFMLQIIGRRAWDYSNNLFNLHGHIDLWHSSLWVLLGFIFLEVIHPFICKILHQEYFCINSKYLTKKYF